MRSKPGYALFYPNDPITAAGTATAWLVTGSVASLSRLIWMAQRDLRGLSP